MLRKFINNLARRSKISEENIKYPDIIKILNEINRKNLIKGIDVFCSGFALKNKETTYSIIVGKMDKITNDGRYKYSMHKKSPEIVINYLQEEFCPDKLSFSDCAGRHFVFGGRGIEKHYIDLRFGRTSLPLTYGVLEVGDLDYLSKNAKSFGLPLDLAIDSKYREAEISFLVRSN